MAQDYGKRDVRMIPDPIYFILCNTGSIDFNQNFSFFGMWLQYIFFICEIPRPTAEFMNTNCPHTSTTVSLSLLSMPWLVVIIIIEVMSLISIKIFDFYSYYC